MANRLPAQQTDSARVLIAVQESMGMLTGFTAQSAGRSATTDSSGVARLVLPVGRQVVTVTPPTGGKEFLLNRRTMAVTDGATWLSHRFGKGVGVSLLGDPWCVRNSRALLLTAYGASIADAVLLAEGPGAAGQTELQNALTRTRTRVGGVEALAVWRFAGGKVIAWAGVPRAPRRNSTVFARLGAPYSL